jgi:preprotein translocase subunit SecE
MARQTRAQRRARRAQMPGGEAALPGGPPTPPRRPTARAESQPEPAREPRRESRGGGGFARFVAESWAELKKVEWPGQNQIIQGVTVVIIACVVVGVFLYVSDLAFKRFVENVLLGQ